MMKKLGELPHFSGIPGLFCKSVQERSAYGDHPHDPAEQRDPAGGSAGFCTGFSVSVFPLGAGQFSGRAGAVAEECRADRYTPLKLTLKIQQPCDYMRLAFFAIGDV